MKLTAADSIKIAAWLKDKKTHQEIADMLGVSRRTVLRHTVDTTYETRARKFQATLAKETEKEHIKQAKVAIRDINFSFSDAARRYMEIADYSKNDFCKLKAVDSLVNLFGVARLQPLAPLHAQPTSTDPDVFEAEWLRKPQ